MLNTNTIDTIINNIKFTADIAEEQKDLFTPSHTLYKCKIKYNGKQYSFNYQCNTQYQKPNKKDCLYCLLSDVSCFDYSVNVDDFLTEFGYTDNLQNIRKGEKAYNACKRTAKALDRIFSDTEIELLNTYFENY